MDHPYTECKPCCTNNNNPLVPPTAYGLYLSYRQRAQGRQPDMLHPFREDGHLKHEEVARLRPDPEFEKWTPPDLKSAFQPSVAIAPPHSFETSNEFIVRWIGIILCWISPFLLSFLTWCGRQVRRCMWDNETGKQITRVILILFFMAVWYWMHFIIYRTIKAGSEMLAELPWCCSM
jgi:hypothetical protein